MRYPRGRAGQISPEKSRIAREKLNEMHDELGSWDDVSEVTGCHQTTVSAVGRGSRIAGVKVWESLKKLGEVKDEDVPQPVENDQDLPERKVIVRSTPLKVNVQTNGNAPDTVPELLQVVRALLSVALDEIDKYREQSSPSPFTQGGIAALREMIEEAKEGSTL